MNNYLFNQNILLVVSLLSGVLYCVSFRILLKLYPTKKLIALTLYSGALLLIETLYCAKLFGLTNIPISSYFIAFACNFILIALILSLGRNKILLYVGIPAFISSFGLLALTINTYYQYYPNLESIFVQSYIKAHDISSVSETHIKQNYKMTSIEQSQSNVDQNKGTVTTINIPGKASGLKARDGYIYLPPAYFDKSLSDTKFPVLILLTGVPGDPSTWLQGGSIINTMDKFAGHHEGITPIIVMADHSGSFTNDTECLDSSQGNAETYLTVDVPSYIKSHYRAATDPVNWGLGGFSEGGMCAAMITLTHQNIFRHFLDMSGYPDPYLDDYAQTKPVLFHNSTKDQTEHSVDWLLKNAKLEPQITAQFAIGGQDSSKLIKEMRVSYRNSLKRNIPTSFNSIANQGHSFSAWSQAYSNAIPRLSFYLGATNCENNCSE